MRTMMMLYWQLEGRRGDDDDEEQRQKKVGTAVTRLDIQVEWKMREGEAKGICGVDDRLLCASLFQHSNTKHRPSSIKPSHNNNNHYAYPSKFKPFFVPLIITFEKIYFGRDHHGTENTCWHGYLAFKAFLCFFSLFEAIRQGVVQTNPVKIQKSLLKSI